jgi:hypothetical protein
MTVAAESVRPSTTERKGKGFFLTLIIGSGVVILALAFLFFQGKEFFIFTWQKFVIEKAVVRALPPDYSVEEVERIRQDLLAFYEAGKRRQVSDEALYGLSQGIQDILGRADQRIPRYMTKQEAEALVAFMHEHGPKPTP